ncbi:MAG: prepilin-type N-terminal cleavage/methylation domain-containing protein [Phycisphaerae bacterium]|nr:prepilin-type N-terminal cleavage/methylation domain-containing protein [Phycisphaerae bacterium]
MFRGSGQHGFTLVEVLIALALFALLMAAMGTAVHGALDSHAENTDLASATQGARVALQRICHDIRTAASVDPYAGTGTLRLVPPEDVDAIQIDYVHDANEQQLLYCVTDGAGQTDHVLLGGDDGIDVTAFVVDHEIADDGEETYIRSTTFALTFEVDGESLTVTASAAPRRNQTY